VYAVYNLIHVLEYHGTPWNSMEHSSVFLSVAPQATLGTMEEEWGLKLNAECNLNFLGVIMDPPEIWTHFHIELWSLIVL